MGKTYKRTGGKAPSKMPKVTGGKAVGYQAKVLKREQRHMNKLANRQGLSIIQYIHGPKRGPDPSIFPYFCTSSEYRIWIQQYRKT